MAEIRLTPRNFQREVLDKKGMVLVDFWAKWCGSSKILAPVLEEIAKENKGVLTVGKVNVDEAMALAHIYEIDSIPTLVLFRNGVPVKKKVGYQEKDHIEKMWK